MSFILQDKNILKLIYKMAADEIPGSVAIDPKIVNKLIDNLYQYSPSKSKAFTGKLDWDRVKISDLNSLNSLLQKIENSELKIGNLYCVSSEAPSAEDIKQAYQKKDNFYVNKEFLKIYLRDVLLRSPSYQTEPLYRTLLGSIVKEANSVFGLDIELPEVSKDDNIFKFNNIIYLDKDLKDSGGDIVLSTSHLSNLDKWFADNRVFLAKSDSLFSGSEKEKKCAFLQYLFTNFPQFRTQIQIAANKYVCGILKGGEEPGQPGKQISPGKVSPSGDQLDLGEMLRRELLSDAPYYDLDAIIFEQDQRGIIPFLERVMKWKPESYRLPCSQLIASFRDRRRQLSPEGAQALSSGMRPQNLVQQFNFIKRNQRNALLNSLQTKFRSDMDNLHNTVVTPLCVDIFGPEKGKDVEWHLLARKGSKNTVIGNVYLNSKIEADTQPE